jgi:hypothetical protein
LQCDSLIMETAEDTFQNFLDRQQLRVGYTLGAVQRRINQRIEERGMPDIEVRKAAGTQSCASTSSSSYMERMTWGTER